MNLMLIGVATRKIGRAVRLPEGPVTATLVQEPRRDRRAPHHREDSWRELAYYLEQQERGLDTTDDPVDVLRPRDGADPS
jgi:hypothetical protein